MEENDPGLMPENTVTVGKTENVTNDEIDSQWILFCFILLAANLNDKKNQNSSLITLKQPELDIIKDVKNWLLCTQQDVYFLYNTIN